MKTVVKIFGLLLLIIAFSTCENKNEDELDKDLYLFDVGQETSWDYWVVDNSGNYLFINEDNNYPSEVFYKPSADHDGYPIFFDDNGIPIKAVIDDIIFLFANHHEEYVDVAIITPDGEITVVRDVDSGFDWDSEMLKSKSFSKADMFRWAGHAVGAVGCAAGLAVTVGTAGIGLPLAAIGCGATIIGLIAEIPGTAEYLGLTSTQLTGLTTLVGCASGNLVTCVTGIGALTFTALSQAEEEIENNSGKVSSAIILLDNELSGGLIAYYPFNGNADDESENNFNGTVYGPTLTQDRYGNNNSAYEFDGENDKIVIPDLELVQPVTFSCWVKTDLAQTGYIYTSDYYESYWADYYGLAVAISADGHIHAAFGDGSYPNRSAYTSETVISADQWHHITVVWHSSGQISIFVDGNEKTYEEHGNANLIIAGNRGDDDTFGADNYVNPVPHYFKGIVDDIRIYERELSEEEIVTLS
jgi:hypothetical protein